MSLNAVNRSIAATVLIFLAAISPAAATERIQVGFGSTINDSEIADILERNSVSPMAAFTWSAGLTGTHRMYEEVLPAEFIVEVRNQAISFFEDAIAANDVRLEKFLASHKKEEVATDEKLQKEARSLLNIRKQFQDALLAARSGGPLVFAIEAEGESGGIAKLLAEPKVRAFVDVDAVSENPKAGAARLKPESYRRDFMDPSVQTISPSDLYDVISEASNSK